MTADSRNVPIEPTEEMILAADERMWEGCKRPPKGSIEYEMWVEVWKAMLAAAPIRPALDVERDALWDRFIAAVKVADGVDSKNFLGSIERYKKLFDAALQSSKEM